jgi:hypothetical protein
VTGFDPDSGDVLRDVLLFTIDRDTITTVTPPVEEETTLEAENEPENPVEDVAPPRSE